MQESEGSGSGSVSASLDAETLFSRTPAHDNLGSRRAAMRDMKKKLQSATMQNLTQGHSHKENDTPDRNALDHKTRTEVGQSSTLAALASHQSA